MSFNIYMHELNEVLNTTFKAQQNGMIVDKVKKNMPKEIGSGYHSIESIGNMLFSQQHYQLNQNIEILDLGHGDIKDYCFLMITLEGNNQLSLQKQKNSYQFSKNQVHLGLSQQNEKYKIKLGQNTIKEYSFTFSKETLLDYLLEFDNAKLINKVEKAEHFDIFKTITLSPSHHYLLQKMMNNPYHGSLKKLYFETCANELMITLLKDLSTKKVYDLILDERDKAQLIKAKEILLEDIQNPPTITELTKMTALNKEKLTKGFKTLFGNTIFKSLTQERMKIAYKHIQENELSVSEISFKAGYENVSNFISVFKKEFGKTPGEMRRK